MYVSDDVQVNTILEGKRFPCYSVESKTWQLHPLLRGIATFSVSVIKASFLGPSPGEMSNFYFK